MNNLVKIFSLLLLAVCLFSASEMARADTVVITGGSMNQQRGDHTYDLTGQGFRASGWGYFGRTPCLTCPAGSVLNLSGGYAGEDSLKYGPATVNGVDYPQLWYAGALTFQTDSFAMPLNSPLGVVTLSIPFTFSGHMTGYLQDPFPGNPGPAVFSVDLSGQGIALFELRSFIDPFIGQSYEFRSLTYNFQTAPVPEPATLLLLGTGLTGLAARARRRRKSVQGR